MPYIIEPLPLDRLQASIVLHVRAHARRTIDPAQSNSAPEEVRKALALLFGVDEPLFAKLEIRAATTQLARLATAAEVVAKQTGTSAVPLGHDDRFVKRCVGWLTTRIAAEPAFRETFATDPATLLVLSEAMDLAVTRSPTRSTAVPVLISGETGTGKEVLAHAIHQMSLAKKVVSKDSFVPIHVAGLSREFVMDELFGHKKGAFTGANETRIGKLEEANGGTVLIDEVGDLSPEAQLRLLRVLQDGKVARTGESSARDTQVRILAATNKDLEIEVTQGRFRRDLLHRLRHGWLELPPLRVRNDSLLDVVDKMLRRHGHTTDPLMVRSARDALICHDWPGNLRELDGVLEIAVASARGTPIRVEHLPRFIQTKYLDAPLEVRAAGDLSDDLAPSAAAGDALMRRIEDVRERIVQRAQVAPEPSLVGIIAFHEKIPDPSAAHAETIARLKKLQAVTRSRDSLVAQRAAWLGVRETGLEQIIEAAVTGEIDRLSTAIDGKDAKLTALREGIDLAGDPWWKLASDVAALPIFDATAKPALLAFIPFAMNVLSTISPELAAKSAARIRQGGLNALRTLATELLRAPDAPLSLQEAFDLENATPEMWIAWADRFPKKREFARAAGRDEKTVAKYAKQACRGSDPWNPRHSKSATRRRNNNP